MSRPWSTKPWLDAYNSTISPWDHLAAWNAWMVDKLREHVHDAWEDMDTSLHTELYALFCDIYDEKEKEIKQLKAENERLREALERYVGKFGDCGDVYRQAKDALGGGE